MPLPHLCNLLALLSVGLVSVLFVAEPVPLAAVAIAALCFSAALYAFVRSVQFHIETQLPSLYHHRRTVHLQVTTVAFGWSQAALGALVLHAVTAALAPAEVFPSLVALVVLGECFAAWFHWAAYDFKRPPRIPSMPAVA